MFKRAFISAAAVLLATMTAIACSSPGNTTIYEAAPEPAAISPGAADATTGTQDASVDAAETDATDASLVCTGTPNTSSPTSANCHAAGSCGLTDCGSLVMYVCYGDGEQPQRPTDLPVVSGTATIADGGTETQVCGAAACVKNGVPCPGDQVGWNCPPGMTPPGEPSCVAPAPEAGQTTFPGDTCCL